MTICYLSLGANLNHPKRQLKQAIAAISSLDKTSVLKTSSLYFTKAWGRKSMPPFYNMVIEINTNLDPHQLLSACLAIERSQHRVRKVQCGARTLDIDILIYGNKKINRSNLKIPHPRMFERDFMMYPLLEINPKAASLDDVKIFTIVDCKQ